MKNIYLSPKQAAVQLKINLRTLQELIINGKLLLYYPENTFGGPLHPVTTRSVKVFFDNPEKARGSVFRSKCMHFDTCPVTNNNGLPREMKKRVEMASERKWLEEIRSLPIGWECKRGRDCWFDDKPGIEIFVEGEIDMRPLQAVKLSDLIIMQEDVDALLASEDQKIQPLQQIKKLNAQNRVDAKQYVVTAKSKETPVHEIRATLEINFGMKGQELHDLIWPENREKSQGAKNTALSRERKKPKT